MVAGLDLSIYDVSIQCGNSGSYAAVSVSGPFTGSGSVTIVGDTVTPSNVVIPSITCTGAGSRIKVGGAKFSGAIQLSAQLGGNITVVSAVEFGAAANYHMWAYGFGSVVSLNGISYIVSGGALRHCYSLLGGYIELTSATCTISGTPAFTSTFIDSQRLAAVSALAFSFTGSATGVRYSASLNGIIYTGGGGASFFPGNSAGATSTGGQYA